MADHTKIEWTDATWNPITGCSVVSAGCKHCYAMKLAGTRLRHHPSRALLTKETTAGPVWTGEVRFNSEWLDQPIRWHRSRKVFVCAHGDLFHEDIPDDWIDQVFAVMALAPQHTYQVLTKRVRRMRDYVSAGGRFSDILEIVRNSELGYCAGGDKLPPQSWPLPNVWMGASVEDQAAADLRIPLLLETPAAVRWVSAEPLLGPLRLDDIEFERGSFINALDLEEWRGAEDSPEVQSSPGKGALIDWVVAGGESGPKARSMHPAWVRSLRDQCAVAGVPFLFKQWGEWVPRSSCYHTFEDGTSCADRDPEGKLLGPIIRLTENGSDSMDINNHDGGDDAYMQRVGKRAAGRLLNGLEHNAYPVPR